MGAPCDVQVGPEATLPSEQEHTLALHWLADVRPCVEDHVPGGHSLHSSSDEIPLTSDHLPAEHGVDIF